MMKKLLKGGVAAISLAAIFVFASCSATVSMSVAANWYANVNLTTSISNTYEKLTYKVTFEEGSNENYQVEYSEGVYTVELENVNYNNELVYKLTSSLSIEGEYTLGTQSLAFSDSVQSECYFRDVSKSLYPLYSKKTVKSTTPRAQNPSTLAEGVAEYDYTMEVTYNPDENTAKSVYTNNKDSSKNAQKTYSLPNNLIVLDNETLLFAARGSSLAVEESEYAYVLNPYAQTVETVRIGLLQQVEEASYTFKNVDAGEQQATAHSLTANTIRFARQEEFIGKMLTGYYAAPVTGNNTYRCAMLKMENPLSYDMGTLVFTLTEADFTNK